MTGELLKIFSNFPSSKLTAFQNDIIITTAEGVIEKFTKSLVCSIDEYNIIY